MYERFTDRARKVMALANQEAQRLRHEYLGTEHILLGLVKEGGGVAAIVLQKFGVDLRTVRLGVEKLVKYGPDIVTMGKLSLTPRAGKVLGYAEEEARKLNHNYIGTEHLLLGLLRELGGVAVQVLVNINPNINLENVRSTMFKVSEELEETEGSETMATCEEVGAGNTVKYEILSVVVRGARNLIMAIRGGKATLIEIPTEILTIDPQSVKNPSVLIITEAGGFRVPSIRPADEGEFEENSTLR